MRLDMKAGSGWWVGVALCVACGGNSVDLGQRDKTGFSDVADLPSDSVDAAPEPQTLYEGETRLIAYTVDETHLYALLDVPEDHGQLVSCPLERCRSERSVLARNVGTVSSGLSSPTPLFVVSDQLYWLSGVGFPANGVARCATSGCEAASVTESPGLEGDLAADADHIYWVDQDGWLMRWGAHAAAADRLRDLNGDSGADGPLIGDVVRLAIAGDYAYFLQENLGLGSYLSRARKDGSSAPEVLANAENASSIAATANEAFYTSQSLAGSVRALPVGGGVERVVVANQRWPLSLQVSGADAFWITRQQPESNDPYGTVVGCSLPDCSSVKAWISRFVLASTGFGYFYPDASRHLALNTRWLFWMERGPNWGSKLRRLPR